MEYGIGRIPFPIDRWKDIDLDEVISPMDA
jgi:hypothetical protein